MINRISKIASMALVLIMALTMAIGCKTVEPEEEVVVETREEATVETAEEVTEEEVEEEEEAEAVEAEEPETVTITDSAGREVTIKLPVERIACSGVGHSEAIKFLGAADKVIAVDDQTSWKKMLLPQLSRRYQLSP